MKIRLIKKKTISDYVIQNPSSRKSFDNWVSKLKLADWNNINDMSATFGTADLLGKRSNRIIFNIGGNNFRMICKFHFGKSFVHLFINWIGAHNEYSRLCSDQLQYTINLY